MLQYVEILNNSKIFSGIIMILLNIGSKYVSIDISKAQEKFLSNNIIRKFLIFTIVFTATRDIIVSIFLTIFFIILNKYILNEHSIVSLIPKSMKNNEVTPDEIEYAKKILTTAYKQKNVKNVESKKLNNIKNYNNNIRKIKKKNLICFLNNIKL